MAGMLQAWLASTERGTVQVSDTEGRSNWIRPWNIQEEATFSRATSVCLFVCLWTWVAFLGKNPHERNVIVQRWHRTLDLLVGILPSEAWDCFFLFQAEFSCRSDTRAACRLLPSTIATLRSPEPAALTAGDIGFAKWSLLSCFIDIFLLSLGEKRLDMTFYAMWHTAVAWTQADVSTLTIRGFSLS